MLEGFFQRSVVWVVLAAGLDDGGAELLFHLAGRRFVLEKIRFARKGLCTEGMVRSVTKDTVRLWRHSRIMNPSGLSLDVWGTGSAFPSADPGGTARARRLVSAQRGIKPGVEYFHSGYLVDDGAEVFCLFAGGVQFFLGNDGGEAFIHENQGKA